MVRVVIADDQGLVRMGLRKMLEIEPREREVLDLLAAGLSNPEICDRLFISDATAKTHVARIPQKLGLRDRVQVVIYAYETGLVRPGSCGPDA